MQFSNMLDDPFAKLDICFMAGFARRCEYCTESLQSIARHTEVRVEYEAAELLYNGDVKQDRKQVLNKHKASNETDLRSSLCTGEDSRQ